MAKVGYFCSYVPGELLSACGLEGVFATPSSRLSPEVEALFPVPFCPLSKTVGEEIRSGDFDFFVLALSCDASRRTREIIGTFFPQKNILSFEVPFGDSAFRIQRFSQELRKLARALAARQGLHLGEIEMRLEAFLTQTFPERKRLGELFFTGNIAGRTLLQHQMGKAIAPQKVERPFLLSGSHLFVEDLAMLLEERNVPFVEETPLGARRFVILPFKGDLVSSSDPFLDLARLYLAYKLPCPREWGMRQRALKELLTGLDVRGILYLYPKFCDFALYDLAQIRAHFPLPLLPLEYELTPNLPQWTTRLEAFLEVTGSA
ncbi:MAG: 2-hydroxyacyl-CoA dehydratase [Candidatus Caldatribacteriaceae bacterium]